ncbi:MAG: PIN domain-containing protein [Methanobacteriota archaeon]
MTKVYLDACVWGRPFDDQSDKKIAEETAAYFEIAWKIDSKEIEVVGSEVLFSELEDISDENLREKIKLLVTKATSNVVRLDDEVKEIAIRLEEKCKCLGTDALHIATAVIGHVDFFITTDYELLKKKTCIKQKFNIDVINPVNFVRNLYG